MISNSIPVNYKILFAFLVFPLPATAFRAADLPFDKPWDAVKSISGPGVQNNRNTVRKNSNSVQGSFANPLYHLRTIKLSNFWWFEFRHQIFAGTGERQDVHPELLSRTGYANYTSFSQKDRMI